MVVVQNAPQIVTIGLEVGVAGIHLWMRALAMKFVELAGSRSFHRSRGGVVRVDFDHLERIDVQGVRPYRNLQHVLAEQR